MRSGSQFTGMISLLSIIWAESTIATGVVLVAGGIMMMRLRWRPLVILACILALVPWPPWNLFLTLPIGIWCFVVVTRSDVRAAFRAVAAERAAARQRS